MNTLTTKQGIGTKVQLCTMMFMQYMLSAVWWVPLAAYLSHTLKLEVYQVSLVLSAMAIGAMASSFIGAIADRYFAAEKILAVLNILTGAFLLLAAQQTSFVPLMACVVLAMLCHMPVSYTHLDVYKRQAKEFQQKRDDPDFVKSQRDDLLSMETGILNNKGRVHFTLTSPINDQLAQLDPNMEKNELIAAIASIIDKEIYKHYRFYPCNYVAYDMLTGTRRFSEHYGLKDKKQFEDYLQGQLDKIVLPNKDEAFLRTKILEMYTNPLKNFFANQE